MRRTHAALLTAALLAAPMGLSGCLVSSNKQRQVRGTYVQPAAFAQIVPNETSVEKLQRVMREPSYKTPNEDGSETWTWQWTETAYSSGQVLLLFSGESEESTSEALHVKIRDGIVCKKWRD